MTDAASDAADDGQPTAEQAALAAEAPAATANGSGAAPPPLAPVGPAATALPPVAAERPELVVGAAFAGGLVLALFLKRLAR